MPFFFSFLIVKLRMNFTFTTIFPSCKYHFNFVLLSLKIIRKKKSTYLPSLLYHSLLKWKKKTKKKEMFSLLGSHFTVCNYLRAKIIFNYLRDHHFDLDSLKI